MLANHRVYATLAAMDLGRAKAWYAEKLGLSPAHEDEGFSLYVAGGVPFMLYESQFAGTAQSTAATWVVDDIDGVMADLRSRGVEFEDYQLGERGPNTEGGIARDPAGGAGARFKDSQGNILSITQLPPGMSLPG